MTFSLSEQEVHYWQSPVDEHCTIYCNDPKQISRYKSLCLKAGGTMEERQGALWCKIPADKIILTIKRGGWKLSEENKAKALRNLSTTPTSSRTTTTENMKTEETTSLES